MSRRRLGTRRALFFGGVGAILPRVGPFSDLAPVKISSLSDITYNGTHLSPTRTSPIVAKTITIGPAGLFSDNNFLWIWCDKMICPDGTAILATETTNFPAINGTDAVGGCPTYNGGNGGSAAAGAGGGWSQVASGAIPDHPYGGAGSTNGGNGADGQASVGCFSGDPGLGGTGNGATMLAGNPFSFPVGGTSTDGNVSTLGGIGAAGSGGLSPGPCGGVIVSGGGGGGAGGGMVVVVCNEIVTVGAYAAGGNAGLSSSTGGFCCTPPPPEIYPGGGGGGGIFFFAKKYPGLSIGHFANDGGLNELGSRGATGPIRIYEINHAGTIITATHTDPNDSWNNL